MSALRAFEDNDYVRSAHVRRPMYSVILSGKRRAAGVDLLVLNLLDVSLLFTRQGRCGVHQPRLAAFRAHDKVANIARFDNVFAFRSTSFDDLAVSLKLGRCCGCGGLPQVSANGR